VPCYVTTIWIYIQNVLASNFLLYDIYVFRRYYAYLDVAVGLAWSNDPESSPGGSVATGTFSHDGQVESYDPD
jgi:hypothetical protein